MKEDRKKVIKEVRKEDWKEVREEVTKEVGKEDGKEVRKEVIKEVRLTHRNRPDLSSSAAIGPKLVLSFRG